MSADLKSRVDTFSTMPGVYLMKDAEGSIIYVGKAKNLRNRVRQYINGGDGRLQIEFLMQRVTDIEAVVCESETQALILERDLIGRHKPRYNIRLKDDKSYLSIRIDQNVEWPRLELVRRMPQDGADYFGPYTWNYELRELLDVIKNVIPLRSCSDTVLYNRTRPCLEYQIKKCVGPCCIPVDREKYMEWVSQAIEILKGDATNLLKVLTEKMEMASQELKFEEAGALRDRIDILTRFTEGHRQVFYYGETRDAFGIFRDGRNVVVSVITVRDGRISDGHNFVLKDIIIDDNEVIEEAIQQFYETHPIPQEVLIPKELINQSMLQDWLVSKKNEEVNIIVPTEGSRERLIGLVHLNAKQHFSGHFDAESRYIEAAKRLSQIAKLRQIPRRIECVDISNFQGSNIVGAIVCFFDGAPKKSEYKKYKISQQGKPDDFAAIYEVVSRRLKKGMETGELPDLLVIDGGAGQLAMALRAKDDLNVDQEIISIAKMRSESEITSDEVKKKPERLFLPYENESIPLDEHDEVTKLMQRVRDEVHRFVITFHRQTRSKRVFRSELDDILGVGPERRQRLLSHFGSVSAIKKSTIEEIAKVGRMPKSLAEKIVGSLK